MGHNDGVNGGKHCIKHSSLANERQSDSAPVQRFVRLRRPLKLLFERKDLWPRDSPEFIPVPHIFGAREHGGAAIAILGAVVCI